MNTNEGGAKAFVKAANKVNMMRDVLKSILGKEGRCLNFTQRFRKKQMAH